MCSVLKLSRGGYYKWLKRIESRRSREDRVLIDEILRLHLKSKGRSGALQICLDLKDQGKRVGRRRVARLMREVGITGVTRRKKWRTTVRDKNARPAPDLVERRFVAQGADQLWVADITELPMTSSRAYLAIVMDVWSDSSLRSRESIYKQSLQGPLSASRCSCLHGICWRLL